MGRLVPFSVKADPQFLRLFDAACRAHGIENRSLCIRALMAAFTLAVCKRRPEACRITCLNDYEEVLGLLASQLVVKDRNLVRKPSELQWLYRDDTINALAEAVARVIALESVEEIRARVREFYSLLVYPSPKPVEAPGVLIDTINWRIYPCPVSITNSDKDDGMGEGVAVV